MDEVIEGLLHNGKWVNVAAWGADSADYDAYGFLEYLENVEIGINSSLKFPDGTLVFLDQFVAFRMGE